MTTNQKLTTTALAIAMLTGCAGRSHLGFEFGQSFSNAFTTQADLTRASIAASEYKLSGQEAASIRLQVQVATTDAESGDTDDAQ